MQYISKFYVQVQVISDLKLKKIPIISPLTVLRIVSILALSVCLSINLFLFARI